MAWERDGDGDRDGYGDGDADGGQHVVKKIKYLMDVSVFATSRTATIWQPESPPPFCFLEIRKHSGKDEQKKNVKILMDVSLFAASRTATKSGRESPLPCVF